MNSLTGKTKKNEWLNLRWTRILKILKTIFINFIVFLFLLIIVELILRVLGFGYGMSPLEWDSKLHHTHRKNYTYTVDDPEGEFGGITVKYDQFRRRVNEKYLKSTEDKEIWFVGDSFTVAVENSWENSFVGKVETLTNSRVINFDVPSYSPLLYFIQLNEELTLKSNKPEIVFIQLYSNCSFS